MTTAERIASPEALEDAGRKARADEAAVLATTVAPDDALPMIGSAARMAEAEARSKPQGFGLACPDCGTRFDFFALCKPTPEHGGHSADTCCAGSSKPLVAVELPRWELEELAARNAVRAKFRDVTGHGGNQTPPRLKEAIGGETATPGATLTPIFNPASYE